MSDLRDRIKQTIESEDVVLFMKGTPDAVYCGNSARALEALRAAGAPVTAVDVLPDPAIRQELSALSQWPTIPQVFIRGELVGGADIVEELAETGELREKLAGALGEARQSAERTERVVEVSDRPNPFRLVPYSCSAASSGASPSRRRPARRATRTRSTAQATRVAASRARRTGGPIRATSSRRTASS